MATKTIPASTAAASAPAAAPLVFKRKASVILPVLKLENDQTCHIRILHPIIEKVSQDEIEVTGPDGRKSKAVVEKTINVAHVQNLVDGEQYHMVLGAILASSLRDYQGGNLRYVGLCFEVTKMPPRPGKRAKDYSIHEVEDPTATA